MKKEWKYENICIYGNNNYDYQCKTNRLTFLQQNKEMLIKLKEKFLNCKKVCFP